MEIRKSITIFIDDEKEEEETANIIEDMLETKFGEYRFSITGKNQTLSYSNYK